jgi:MFS family permease
MQWFRSWYRQKKNHYLFPLFTLIAGTVVGMLVTPTIGAICISISFYLALVIFIPWDKLHWRLNPYIFVFFVIFTITVIAIILKWKNLINVFQYLSMTFSTILLSLVIIKPSDKIWHLYKTYFFPAIVCIAIILPTWVSLTNIFPSSNPYRQLIRSVSGTVDISVSSNDKTDIIYLIPKGMGDLAFGEKGNALLTLSSTAMSAKQTGQGVVIWHGVFDMPATSEATKNSIRFLNHTDTIQIRFGPIPENTVILGGEAIITINNTVRLDFPIPAQTTDNYKAVFISDIQKYLGDFK